MQVSAPYMSTTKPQTIMQPNCKHTCKPKPKAKLQSLASTLPQAQAQSPSPQGQGIPTAQAPSPYPAQAQTAQRHTLPQACPMPQRAKPLHNSTQGAKRATAQPYRATTQSQADQTRKGTRNVQGGKLCNVQAPLAEFIICPLGRRKAASPS